MWWLYECSDPFRKIPIVVDCNTNLSTSQYQSICMSVSCACAMQQLAMRNIAWSTNSSSDNLPALDLQTHHRLETLKLNKLPISGLLLPNHVKSLVLSNLVLSHDNLEQPCRSQSSLGGLELELDNLSCRDHSGSRCLPVLDLQTHHRDAEI